LLVEEKWLNQLDIFSGYFLMPRQFRSNDNVFHGKPSPSRMYVLLEVFVKNLMTSELSVEEIPSQVD
jgi:hypothetical protein